jgi:hypothetical protein
MVLNGADLATGVAGKAAVQWQLRVQREPPGELRIWVLSVQRFRFSLGILVAAG